MKHGLLLLNALFGLVLVVVGVYYRRKELQDSSIGRRVLADTQRFLRWRSNAQVIAELHALGKFFGAIALLCLAVTMLGDRIFRAPMVESSIATIHLGFAWMSIYVVLDPHKFVRKSVREISTITLGGPSLFLILDVLPPGADTLDAYARVWQPVLDLTAYHGIELALYFTALHAAVLVAALLIYGLLFATIPALLYFVLAGSKRFCSTVIGLPDERLKNFMAAGFLAVTLYAGLRMAIS